MRGRFGRRLGTVTILAVCLGASSCSTINEWLGRGKYEVVVDRGEREDVRALFLVVNKGDELQNPEDANELLELINPGSMSDHCVAVQLEPADVDRDLAPDAPDGAWCWKLAGEKDGEYTDLVSVQPADDRPFVEFVLRMNKIATAEGGPLAAVVALQGVESDGSGSFDWQYYSPSVIEARDAIRIEIRENTLKDIAE